MPRNDPLLAVFFLPVWFAIEKRSLLDGPVWTRDFFSVDFSLASLFVAFGAGPSSKNIFLMRSSSDSRKSLNFVSFTLGIRISASKDTSTTVGISLVLRSGTSRVLEGVRLAPSFDREESRSCDDDLPNIRVSGAKLPFAFTGPWQCARGVCKVVWLFDTFSWLVLSFEHSELNVNDVERSLSLSLISDNMLESRVEAVIDKLTLQSACSIADINDFISLFTGSKSWSRSCSAACWIARTSSFI